jgi:adenosine deaminase
VPPLLAGLTEPDRLHAALYELWRRPKVELHLHLEATLRLATVSEMARRHDPSSRFARPGWHVGYFTFRDLNGFVEQFRPVHRSCVRDAEDLERLAREGFEDLAAQQVRYVEVRWSARPPGHPLYLPLSDALAAVERARRATEAQSPLKVGLILAINRAPGLGGHIDARAGAVRLVEEALRARDAGIGLVGIDLHGDEQSYPAVEPFAEAFSLAGRAGLGLRAHAGEGAGAASVRAALDVLGVQRIGHGVRAIEDAALVADLAERRIPLDLCPTSNVRTGTVPSPAALPIRELLAAGIPVSIGSDDPLVFETSVTSELALLQVAHGFTLAELGGLTQHAVAASFLPPADRATLSREIAAGWR